MLHFYDVILTLVHVAVLTFNLFGWAWPAARRAHLICIILTASSWFILGIWFGIGYCPFTDWQWQVKERLGEHNLPASFIKYFADRITGHNFSPTAVNTATLISFSFAAFLAVYFNFFNQHGKRDAYEIH